MRDELLKLAAVFEGNMALLVEETKAVAHRATLAESIRVDGLSTAAIAGRNAEERKLNTDAFLLGYTRYQDVLDQLRQSEYNRDVAKAAVEVCRFKLRCWEAEAKWEGPHQLVHVDLGDA